MRDKPLPGLSNCPKCGKLKSACGCDYKKSPIRKSSPAKIYSKPKAKRTEY